MALSRFLNQCASDHGSMNKGPNHGSVPQNFPFLRAANLDGNLHICSRAVMLFLVPGGCPSPSDPSEHPDVHTLLIAVDEILAATVRDDGVSPWPWLPLLALAQAQPHLCPSPQPAEGDFSASLSP